VDTNNSSGHKPIKAPSGFDLHPKPQSVLRVRKGEMTNYRVKEQTYIVDRLLDRACLVLGSGEQSQKVEINRGHK
jgi:type IV secretory pathway VirB9-like protein